VRKKVIAGNWKMHLTKTEAHDLVNAIISNHQELGLNENKICILAPSFVYLDSVVRQLASVPYIFVASQNCSEHGQGAFTGEVSVKMLQSIGVQYIIIGHSERRQYFNETDDILLQKIRQTLEQNLQPIFCCGEPLEIRENLQYFDFIKLQLEACLFRLSEAEILQTIIAYEPVWAIGTGKTSTPAQAQEVHQFIRNCIKEKYNASTAEQISILYGGSVQAQNAAQLFAQQDIDGALVGGASLKAKDFMEIIKAAG
jgi:triosephosphate isomerase